MVSPGILAIFILGLFWKKTTNKAAIWGALVSIPIAMFFKIGPKGWAEGTALESVFPSVPFLDQMGYTTLLTMAIIALLSWYQNKGANDANGFELRKETFKTSATFNVSAFAIMIVLVFLYSFFWK